MSIGPIRTYCWSEWFSKRCSILRTYALQSSVMIKVLKQAPSKTHEWKRKSIFKLRRHCENLFSHFSDFSKNLAFSSCPPHLALFPSFVLSPLPPLEGVLKAQPRPKCQHAQLMHEWPPTTIQRCIWTRSGLVRTSVRLLSQRPNPAQSANMRTLMHEWTPTTIQRCTVTRNGLVSTSVRLLSQSLSKVPTCAWMGPSVILTC
jgi:hypothetical protein